MVAIGARLVCRLNSLAARSVRDCDLHRQSAALYIAAAALVSMSHVNRSPRRTIRANSLFPGAPPMPAFLSFLGLFPTEPHWLATASRATASALRGAVDKLQCNEGSEISRLLNQNCF